MKIVLVAAVALIDADGRVLISKRPEGKQMGAYGNSPAARWSPTNGRRPH